MSKTVLILLLAIFSLLGCAESDKATGRTGNRGPVSGSNPRGDDLSNGGGAPVVETDNQEADELYNSMAQRKVGTVTDSSLTDSEFRDIIRRVMATGADETYTSIDIGSIDATASATQAQEGVKIWLDVPESAGNVRDLENTEIDLSQISLLIRIYDSYVQSEDFPPIEIRIGQFVETRRRDFYELDDIYTFEFEDEFATLFLDGIIEGDDFTGELFYQNRLNEYGNPFPELIGDFRIPLCSIQNNCQD